jgi:hypothetical protein
MPDQDGTPDVTGDGLWCVHLAGADDLTPCASREAAYRAAMWLNLSLWRHTVLDRHRLDAPLWASPAPWHGTPGDHATGLTEADHDPRWSTLTDRFLLDCAKENLWKAAQ